MARILVTTSYAERNEYRKKELEQSMLRNMLVFDKIVLVCESELNIKHPKIEIYNLVNRPYWSDMIRFANSKSNDNDLVIIANSDIYFDNLSQFDNIDFKDSCLALSRWDTKESDYKRDVKEPTLHNTPDSQDSWIFEGKIKPVFGEFVFGALGSDNRIMYELERSGYSVYNPSKEIKSFHLHTIKSNKYGNPVPKPYKTIHPTDLIVVPKKKKYNILHIGMKAYEAEYGLCDALEKSGNYEFIEWQKFHTPYPELNTPQKRIELTNEIMSKCIGKDLIFIHIQTEGVVTAGMLKLVHDLNPTCKIVNFNGDVRNEIPEFMYELGKECITLYTNEHDVNLMKKKGYDARYMNVGFDPLIYKPEGNKANCAPIVFIGNNYKDHPFPMSKFRDQMVHELKEEFGDKFAVYGNGWGELSEGYLTAYDEAEVLRGCKAVINVSHFEYERYSSDRLHRSMGCGTMVCNKNFPKQEIDFGNGTMYNWETIKDLKERIYWILNIPEKDLNYYKSVKDYATEFAKENLTWEKLIKKLIYELDRQN